MRAILANWLMGPGSTFRNGRRTWLYLGYLGLVVGLLAAVARAR